MKFITLFFEFCIVYIDDVLIFSKSIEQHFKHLKTFYLATRKAGLAISNSNVSLFQTKVIYNSYLVKKYYLSISTGNPMM